MDQTRYKSKSWVIKSRFSFNVRQHGQQQLYLQCCKLNSLQYNRCSFIFTTLLVHTTTPAISAKIPFLYFSHFSPPSSTLICSQNHFYNPHYTPFQFQFYIINFLPLYFWIQPSQQSAPKAFSLPQPFSQLRLPQGNTMKSRKDWHWFNLSLLPQSMTVITGLTTTNSFSLRLIKLVMTGNEDDEDLWWRWLQSE